MSRRFIAIAIIWVLLLASAFVAEPYFIAWQFSAAKPRTISPRANLEEAEKTRIKLFQTVSPSVVYVFARTAPEQLFGPEEHVSDVQAGTGIVWDAAGHVITNYHVIKGADQFAAHLQSGESVPVRVIGTAPNYDLAVLQLERTNVPLRPIAVGSSSDLQVGQSAFAIGTPYGLEQTLTSGIVSALHRKIPTAEGHEIAGGIQTDAPLNPGNSGGPLLDSSGRLIGVTTMIISGSGASAGIGIAAAPETASAQLGLSGVIILKVYPGSPAEKAGLKGVTFNGEVQDVITAANGQSVENVAQLASIFEELGPGKPVTLTVERGGKSRSVEVTLADVSRKEG